VTDSRKPITPEMRVAELLRLYPEVEERLLEISPAFSKLKNPVLRRTVAKVTSLRQAAVVGGVKLEQLINRLREAAGFDAEFETVPDTQGELVQPPAWWEPDKVVLTLDARPILNAGEKPLSRVMADFSKLQKGQIYRLIAPFEPAPLIDIGKDRGLESW